jgi:hypothetical protein
MTARGEAVEAMQSVATAARHSSCVAGVGISVDGGLEVRDVKFSKDRPWDLPIRDFDVFQVVFGSCFIDVIAESHGGSKAMVRLTGLFELAVPDGAVLKLDVSEQSWEELAVLLALRRDRIASATVSEHSMLRVAFRSGRVLSVCPDRASENWEMHGPGFLMICMPGGEVAVWDTDAPAITGCGPENLPWPPATPGS